MEAKHSFENGNGDDLAARVRRALAGAAIGRDVIFAGLADAKLQGLGSVSVADGTATVTITLPIPSRNVHSLVEREIRRVALSVDGVSMVECRFEPRAADPGTRVDFIPDVKNLVAVASGKGGVGKSTVAINLSVALADAGASVGLMDADVYGPNAPAMLGLADRKPNTTPDDRMIPREAHGVSVMSMGFITNEDDPVIWRGPLVDEFIKQLFGDVEWGELDYLIVDLPPGTGDAQLSLVQHLPVTGAIIVTTPQPVAVDDARRGLRGFARYDVPIVGIVENMQQFKCPDCGTEHDIFDAGGADQLCAAFDVPVLGQIPLDPSVGTLQSETGSSESLGITLPGIGRLQLPRTREERENLGNSDPIVIRDSGGDTREAVELLATRTTARINILATRRDGSNSQP